MQVLVFVFALANADSDARQRVESATVAYKLGQFAEALEQYEQAYRLVQAPGLLFNIGQCHRGLKQHERAVFFFRGYLRDKPNAANRALVDALIREEEAAQAQDAVVALAQPKQLAAASQPASGLQAGNSAQPSSSPQPETGAQPSSSQQPETGAQPSSSPQPVPLNSAFVEPTQWYARWWVWTIVGVVVAGAVAGTVVGVTRSPYSLGIVDRQ